MKHQTHVPTLVHLLCRFLCARTLMPSNMGGAWSWTTFSSLRPGTRYSLHVPRLIAHGMQQGGLQMAFASKSAQSCNTLKFVLLSKMVHLTQDPCLRQCSNVNHCPPVCDYQGQSSLLQHHKQCCCNAREYQLGLTTSWWLNATHNNSSEPPETPLPVPMTLHVKPYLFDA